MALLQAILLLALLSVCCFGPGFFFVRKLRWAASEKVCLSIALSLIIIYLSATAIYWMQINWKWCWLVTAGCMTLTWLSRHEITRLMRRAMPRRQALAFLMLFGLGLLAISVIRQYSGGLWAGDWVEHYQRSLFFLQRLPYDHQFIDGYVVASRPPMTHLIAAYFMAHVSAGFDLFQIVSLFLNTLAFLPCVLIANLLVPHGAKRVWLVAAFLATAPVFMQNITWTWNKEMTAFFILLSIALYVRGWRNGSRTRIVAAATSMAAAVITHYSAGPYALFLLLHCLWVYFREHRKPSELRAPIFAAAALLLTWFAWSIAVYGFIETFESNTTVTDAAKLGATETIQSIIENTWNTVIPHTLRMSPTIFGVNFDQPNAFGYVRDYFFNLYQPNLLLSLGIFGWVTVPLLMLRLFRAGDRRVGLFWIAFLCVVVPLGIIVNSASQPLGVAHICLQPLALVGRTLLAAGLHRMSRWLRATLAISLAIDAIFGVFLQFRMEMIGISASTGSFHVIPISSRLLSFQAVYNSAYRYRYGFTFWSDHFAMFSALVLLMLVVLLGCNLLLVASAATGRDAMLLRKPSRLGVLVIAIFAAGTIVCICDHAMGFNDASVIAAAPLPSEEQYNLAIMPLLKSAQANPESADVFYRLGVVCYQFGQLDKAVDAFSNAILLQPNHVGAHYLLGLIQVAYRVLIKDDDVYAVFCRTEKQDEQTYVNYGAALYARGFKGKGREVLADAMNRYRNGALAHAAYGTVLFQAGQTGDAIAQYETALRLNPGSTETADTLRSMMRAAGSDPASIDAVIRQIRGGR